MQTLNQALFSLLQRRIITQEEAIGAARSPTSSR